MSESAAAAERGLPILRDTGCKVGAHVFVWYSAHGGELPHHPEQRCLCGLVTWEESHAA